MKRTPGRARSTVEEGPPDLATAKAAHRTTPDIEQELATHKAELELQNEELNTAQEALQEARDSYAALYEQAPVGYLVLDAAGIVRQANGTWRAMRGRNDEDPRGQPFADALHPDDARVFHARFRALLRNPAGKQMVLRVTRKGRPPFHARLEARPRAAAPPSDGPRDPADLMVIVSDISELHAAQARSDRLNAVLRGIRDVSQLITQEDDRDRLIRGACTNLTETLSYRAAWIALLNDPGAAVVAVDGAGFEERLGTLRERLAAGRVPDCMQRALATDAVVVVDDPPSRCADCPLAPAYGGRAGFTRRLAHAGRVYGVLSVSVPGDYASDAEEQSLFAELAGDLGFALHKIEMGARLRRGEALLNAAQTLARVGGWEWDLLTQTMTWTDEAYRIHDLEPGEVPAGSDAHVARSLACYDEGDRDTVLAAFRRCVETGEAYNLELPFTTCRGRRLWIRTAAEAVMEQGRVTRVIGVIMDITNRKRNEERIALLGRMVDEAPASITVHDMTGRFLYANRETLRLHGYDREEDFLSLDLHALDTPQDAHLIEDRMRAIERDGEARFEVEHFNRNGARFPLDVYVKRTLWNGRPAMLSIATDITERRAAERALRESQERFARAFQTAPYALAITRADDGRILEINEAFVAATGYTREEILNHTTFELALWMRPEDREEVIAQLRTGHGVFNQEYRFRRKNGTELVGLFSAQALELSDVPCVLSSINDVTEQHRNREERNRLQQQLYQVQKMESIGRLAGGVAHDFNNLLMGIMNYTELCRDGVAPGHPIRQWLDEIMVESRRSAELVRQLLAFARRQVTRPKRLNLNEQIEGMLKMLRRLIGEHIDLTWSPGAALHAVSADPSQIDQIMANLCVNAADAIDGTGCVAIATHNAVLNDASCAGRPDVTPGPYVILTVSDSGCGMDADTKANAFEPFFTTKSLGRGTGLGLATVFGIVSQSGGFIELDSAPGVGTTFRIYLRALADAEPETTAPARNEPPPGGTETLLVVDDERSILRTLTAHLERLGYTVLAAGTPAEALNLAEQHPDSLALLLTDMVMPEMNGLALRSRLLTLCPQLKTIVMTGYTEHSDEIPDSEEHALMRMNKPIPLSELAVAIRRMLAN